MIVRILALALGLFALLLNFRSKYFIEKFTKQTEPPEGMVLRVKYAALALAVIAFLAVFLIDV